MLSQRHNFDFDSLTKVAIRPEDSGELIEYIGMNVRVRQMVSCKRALTHTLLPNPMLIEPDNCAYRIDTFQ